MNEPMTLISIRLPGTMINQCRRLAPILGFSGYQPLIRSYIAQGLGRDWPRVALDEDVPQLLSMLRELGVEEEILAQAVEQMESENEDG